jgi:hypothetical protein
MRRCRSAIRDHRRQRQVNAAVPHCPIRLLLEPLFALGLCPRHLCGFADGLPIGLQVVGPLYADLAVLRACWAYEEATGAAWPLPGLEAQLAAITATPDAAVEAKRWTLAS